MNNKGVVETYTGVLVGYKRKKEIERENFDSHEPFESEWTTFYLKTESNLMTFEIKIEAGECRSGYTTSTYGSLQSVKKLGILEKDFEMKELDFCIIDAKILARRAFEEFDDLFEIYQNDRLIIRLDVNGGDDYYPDGSIIYENDIKELFYINYMHDYLNNQISNQTSNQISNQISNQQHNHSEHFRGKRGFDKDIKYIFTGKSNTTKSTMALKIFAKDEIYETDAMKNEYDFLNVDITQHKVIVLGGKYIKSDESISNIVKYYVNKYPQYQFIQCSLSCV